MGLGLMQRMCLFVCSVNLFEMDVTILIVSTCHW